VTDPAESRPCSRPSPACRRNMDPRRRARLRAEDGRRLRRGCERRIGTPCISFRHGICTACTDQGGGFAALPGGRENLYGAGRASHGWRGATTSGSRKSHEPAIHEVGAYPRRNGRHHCGRSVSTAALRLPRLPARRIRNSMPRLTRDLMTKARRLPLADDCDAARLFRSPAQSLPMMLSLCVCHRAGLHVGPLC